MIKINYKKEYLKKEHEKRGRPTRYKDEYCSMLAEHLKQGFSYETFAAVVGVNVDTLYEWEKRFPEFSEAKKNFWTASYLFWEKIGIDGVMGKIPGFNSTAWIFTMKNRFGWRDKREIEHSGAEGKPIEIRTRNDQIKNILSDPDAMVALELLESKLLEESPHEPG